MSIVHDKLQTTEVADQGWYLRTSDGSVYGPVETGTLSEWAAQYRLAPGNLVSRDRKEWVGVESLPELKMDWMAEQADGSLFGPFNVLAVPVLAQTGTLTADATLKNRRSGKRLQVEALLKSRPKPVQAPLDLPSGDGEQSRTGEPTKDLLEAAHVRRAGYMPLAPGSASKAAAKKAVGSLLRQAVETSAAMPVSEPASPQPAPSSGGQSAPTPVPGASSETARRTEHVNRELGRVQSDHRKLEQQHRLTAKALNRQKERNDVLERTSSSAQDALTTRVKRLEEQLAKATHELERARRTEASADVRRDYEALKREAERRERELKHELDALREQARITGETLGETKRALAESQRQHEQLELSVHRDVDGSEERLTAAQVAAEKRVRELEEIVAEKDDQLRGQVETLKHAAATAEHRFASDLETQRTRYRRLEQDASKARAGLESRISDLEASLSLTREGLELTKNELDLARSAISTTRGTAEERERCLQVEIDQICENLQQRDADLVEARQKHQTLKERAERMEADLEKESTRLASDLEVAVRAEEELQKRLEWQQKEYAALKKEADVATRQVSEAKLEIAGLRKQYEAALKDSERREKAQAKRLLKQETVLKAAEALPLETPPAREVGKAVWIRRWVLAGTAAVVASVALVAFAFAAGRQFGYQAAVTRYMDGEGSRAPANALSLDTPVPDSVDLPSGTGSVTGSPDGTAGVSPGVAADPSMGAAVTAAVAALPMTEDAAAPVAAVTDADAPEAPSAPAWPDLAVAGTALKKDADQHVVVFHEGVFARDNVVTRQAVVILEDLASRLRGRMDDFVLVIEGHTDSVPVSREAVFADNIQLGERRARTVKSVLVSDFGMAPDALRVTSVGEKQPPYPNDTQESRLKNRTVVLRLLLRDDVSKMR